MVQRGSHHINSASMSIRWKPNTRYTDSSTVLIRDFVASEIARDLNRKRNYVAVNNSSPSLISVASGVTSRPTEKDTLKCTERGRVVDPLIEHNCERDGDDTTNVSFDNIPLFPINSVNVIPTNPRTFIQSPFREMKASNSPKKVSQTQFKIARYLNTSSENRRKQHLKS